MYYPRDLHGYGNSRPKVRWPRGAAIAVQFVVNYEEGGENCVLHGDSASEAFLSEIVGAKAWPAQRHWNMESIYGYGARAGFWRLHELFTNQNIPVTIYGVATALQRSPEQVQAMLAAKWEIASHGLKWIEYKDFSREQEKDHLEQAIALHTAATGSRPTGWYLGRCSHHTVDLVTEEGGFRYISDAYDDDLPYWRSHLGRDQLLLPYTLDCNDMRFATPQGFNAGDQFETYLRDTFDILYEEGLRGSPKVMNIGLHCRLIGRPGRFAALKRFINYINAQPNVWFARRIDIADHWAQKHPPKKQVLIPSLMDEEAFVQTFGGIFEHSSWVAERARAAGLGAANDTAQGLHHAMSIQFRLATDEMKLAVLRAHPDLAGKLAAAKRLTPESTREQAGAGFDALTDHEKETFSNLNESYTDKFGFPFIIAVKGLGKTQILSTFKQRIENHRDEEFRTACRQVEKIAHLRLKELLP